MIYVLLGTQFEILMNNLNEEPNRDTPTPSTVEEIPDTSTNSTNKEHDANLISISTAPWDSMLEHAM